MWTENSPKKFPTTGSVVDGGNHDRRPCRPSGKEGGGGGTKTKFMNLKLLPKREHTPRATAAATSLLDASGKKEGEEEENVMARKTCRFGRLDLFIRG